MCSSPVTSAAFLTDDDAFEPLFSPSPTSLSHPPDERHFDVSELSQTSIGEVIEGSRESHRTSPHEVRLGSTLRSIWIAVGIMQHQTEQIGTCVLISSNLALIPCHCIEGLDVRQLKARFGYGHCNGSLSYGRTYSVQSVVEFHPHLDYAIVRLEGNPGLNYRFLSLKSSSSPPNEPALLHYPLNKSLQVSVNKMTHPKFQSRFLLAEHDTEFGSSGGAYIHPSGEFFAIHLGSQRNLIDFSVMCFVLPINAIIDENPKGIVTLLAHQRLKPEELNETIGEPTYYIYPFPRNYIDFEKWQQERVLPSGYLLRFPTDSFTGILIDRNQSDYLPCWPGGRREKRGVQFSLTLDDAIELAEEIVKNHPDIFDHQITIDQKFIFSWTVDESLLRKELLKKVLHTSNKIQIHATFSNGSWSFYFYPPR